jgi:FkbM family methyltransferase
MDLIENQDYVFVKGHGIKHPPFGHYLLCSNDDGSKRNAVVPYMDGFKLLNFLPTDTVVDIGAYCGTFFCFVDKFRVDRVDFYEPTMRAFYIASMNAARCKNKVVGHHSAIVAGIKPVTEFYISPGIGVTNRLWPASKSRKVVISATQYSRAVKNATVVKIDIEGGEYNLPLVQPSLRQACIDFHPIPRNKLWTDEADSRIAEFEAAGFTCLLRPTWKNGWSRVAVLRK